MRPTLSSGADARALVAAAERDLDLGEDLLADELVARDQRVAQRDDDVAVVLEELADAALLLIEDLLDLLASVPVREHTADEVLRADRALGDRVVGDERPRHPERADHLRGERRRRREVVRRPGPALAEEQLLGHEATEGDRDRRFDLRACAGEALLLVAVGE